MIYAISDIHGCLDSLKKMLVKIKYDSKKDTLILLGDYVDRGKEPIATLFFVDDLIKKGAVALLGNHDKMFLDSIESNNKPLSLDQRRTLKQYKMLNEKDKEKVKNILKSLKNYFMLDKYVFVHAGVNADFPLEKNEIDDFIWARESFYENKAYVNKVCIFGHTPTCFLNKDESLKIWHDKKYNDKIGIDCGCVFNDGKLACLELTTMKEHYV